MRELCLTTSYDLKKTKSDELLDFKHFHLLKVILDQSVFHPAVESSKVFVCEIALFCFPVKIRKSFSLKY